MARKRVTYRLLDQGEIPHEIEYTDPKPNPWPVIIALFVFVLVSATCGFTVRSYRETRANPTQGATQTTETISQTPNQAKYPAERATGTPEPTTSPVIEYIEVPGEQVEIEVTRQVPATQIVTQVVEVPYQVTQIVEVPYQVTVVYNHYYDVEVTRIATQIATRIATQIVEIPVTRVVIVTATPSPTPTATSSPTVTPTPTATSSPTVTPTP